MHFQRLKPYGPETAFVHHPCHSLPYFASMTLLQRASLLVSYLHNHLPNKSCLTLLKHLILNDAGQIRDLLTFSCGGFREGKKKKQREVKAV